MYQVTKHNIKNYSKPMKNKYKNSFLNEFGAGLTCSDKLVEKLVSTCEEGIDYSKLDFISEV